jgi:hypothetical protein
LVKDVGSTPRPHKHNPLADVAYAGLPKVVQGSRVKKTMELRWFVGELPLAGIELGNIMGVLRHRPNTTSSKNISILLTM